MKGMKPYSTTNKDANYVERKKQTPLVETEWSTTGSNGDMVTTETLREHRRKRYPNQRRGGEKTTSPRRRRSRGKELVRNQELRVHMGKENETAKTEIADGKEKGVK